MDAKTKLIRFKLGANVKYLIDNRDKHTSSDVLADSILDSIFNHREVRVTAELLPPPPPYEECPLVILDK